MDNVNEKGFDLIEQFTRIEWLLHRYHQQNHTQHGPMGDPRRGQGRVLALLKLQPEISQRELSYLLDMRPQSLGELLSKLERNGYITRTPSETDRRVMNIRLTQEGAAATEQEFSFDKLFECLSEEEQSNLSCYLDRIIDTLEAQLGDEQPEHGFDPRRGGDNPFYGGFGGPRGFEGGGDFRGGGSFDPRRGRAQGYPGDGRFDPRREMGWGSPRMRRGERPAPSQDKPDEE